MTGSQATLVGQSISGAWGSHILHRRFGARNPGPSVRCFVGDSGGGSQRQSLTVGLLAHPVPRWCSARRCCWEVLTPLVPLQHSQGFTLSTPVRGASPRKLLHPKAYSQTADVTRGSEKKTTSVDNLGQLLESFDGDRAAQNGETSTSGRDGQQAQRPPPAWRRRREGEQRSWGAGLPPEVVETMALLRRERDPEMAKGILQRLEGVSRGLVVNALDEFQRRGEARCCIVVLRFILEQGNYRNESKFVNKVLSLLVQARSWTAFDALVAEVRSQGVELQVAAYNTLLKGYAVRRRVDQAVQLVAEMREAGLQPDGITYNALMSAYVKAGDVGGAVQVLDEMRAGGVAPNTFHFSLLADAYARVGDLSGGLSVFQRMTEEGVLPDLVLYNALINLHCKVGSPLQAHGVLKEMSGKGVTPNLTSYTRVLEGLAKLGQGPEAEDVLERATNDGMKPTLSLYCLVMRAHIKCNDLAAARDVVGRVTDAGMSLDPDDIAFGSFSFLIREFVRQGEVHTAEVVLGQLEAASASRNGGAFAVLRNLIRDSNKTIEAQGDG